MWNKTGRSIREKYASETCRGTDELCDSKTKPVVNARIRNIQLAYRLHRWQICLNANPFKKQTIPNFPRKHVRKYLQNRTLCEILNELANDGRLIACRFASQLRELNKGEYILEGNNAKNRGMRSECKEFEIDKLIMER
ncbi:hypothetical protein P5673_011876 [Acropora cervicornis]|uniref:Uncharacterized protein n=1 Tax=Acropora cervicornis TaxID=6130 RepID=A0AAD9QNK2_ACRCE|nr:hypothetical protein P5673_011876 [Acropora cervicornis]